MPTQRPQIFSFRCAVCALLLSILFSINAFAATLYVDVANTSGIEDGSQADPFSTIQAAIDAATAGDTILVAKGTYYESLFARKRLRILGEDPESTVIRGAQYGLYAYAFNDAGTLEIAGFTVSGALYGIRAGGGGGSYSPPSVVVHNCILAGNGDGIRVEYPSPASISVYNSVIVGSSHAAVYAYAEYLEGYGSASVTSSLLMQNATALMADLDRYYGSGSISSTYNTYFDNGQFSGGGGDIMSANDSLDDPLIVDMQSGDFHLLPGSPAIDAGNPAYVDNDPDGSRNDQGVFGGPGAAGFWSLNNGNPVVTAIQVTPSSAGPSDTLTVTATGQAQ